MEAVSTTIDTDVLIVGAGPAGSAAAFFAAKQGLSALLIDAEEFPRDKTCGDGLTPRATHQLAKMGLLDHITERYQSNGLKLHGFGGSVTAPWPDSPFGQVGSACRRTELDHLLVKHAAAQPEVTTWLGATVHSPVITSRITEVTVTHEGVDKRVRPRHVIVADGVRSTFGKQLGRTWHRGEVYGIAARSYCTTPLADEPWIHSHLELRSDGIAQPGYGWIFPLGDGTANVGCGALSTDKRPARLNTKKVLREYALSLESEWSFGTPENVASALLPMGGAVTNVAGPNWMLIGDAAACVNPLNGEGIDYALETAELAAQLCTTTKDLTLVWPHVLREHYGEAFLLARTLARALTYPQFLPVFGPIGLRVPVLMQSAARLMGNLVTEEDKDVVSWSWRKAGKYLSGARSEAPLWGKSFP
ncbi:geranylgeranyl reductase family protein [Corynebacterium sp. H130]|uniref:geranylgeranyl reductase family protein n=1 Tax=Corynebacterium sp. H130 TaxID=3133444 RepID=UPI0030AC1622